LAAIVSRDTGNRISCARLRAGTETRDSDFLRGLRGIARAIGLTRRGFDDSFSVSLNSAAAGTPSRRASRAAGAPADHRPL